MKTKTTIAIITKNRPHELLRCLYSIAQQTKQPNVVVVIDNDLKKSAQKTIKKFLSTNRNQFKSLIINYYQQIGTVPKCRNFTLQTCNNPYLGFIDDDCVLEKNWLEQALQTINQTNSAYVLGETRLLNENSTIALAQHTRDTYWRKQKKRVTFDTKNVLLRLKDIKKNQLRFDEQCQSLFYDSADFDFDFQLREKKISGYFCADMIVYHQETSLYQRFVQRAWHRGALARYLTTKWQPNEQFINPKDYTFSLWLLRTLKNFPKEYQRYAQEMTNQPIYKRVIATWLIRVFERYYALGYDAANKKHQERY